VIPPYITAVSWANVLGSRGIASSLWGETTAQVVSSSLYGLPGSVLVLASTFMPAVMLATMTFVRTVNPRLEEAARLSARPLRVLCGVTVPLMRPGLVLAATLVFLLALGEFGAPQFLRYAVFPGYVRRPQQAGFAARGDSPRCCACIRRSGEAKTHTATRQGSSDLPWSLSLTPLPALESFTQFSAFYNFGAATAAACRSRC
jgi:hypothetical protein